MGKLAPILLALLMAAGCGYRQNNQYEKGPAPAQGPRSDVRSISVPTFANNTQTPGAENAITQAVRDALVATTSYKLREQAQADTAIEGRITLLELKSATPTTMPTTGPTTGPAATEYKRIRAEFRWRDLWVEKDLSGWNSVEATSPAGIGAAVMASIGVRGASTPGRDGGYAWHSLYRQDVRTIAVPIFTNKTFVRGLEFQLTKAIGNYLESSTPYKVVSREQADTILEGEIVNVTGVGVSLDRNTNLPQEEMITIRVNFVWKDLRSGRILRQCKNFDQSTMYYPTLGEGAYVGKQSGAERLAVGIVQELQADW